MKKPRLDRGPKPSNAIMQPQMMITSGVRHELEAGRSSSAVTAMRFPGAQARPGNADRVAPDGVNAFAWKSQGPRRQNFRRRAALQNRRVQSDGGEICDRELSWSSLRSRLCEKSRIFCPDRRGGDCRDVESVLSRGLGRALAAARALRGC